MRTVHAARRRLYRGVGAAVAAASVAGCAAAAALPSGVVAGADGTAGSACLKAIAVVSDVQRTMGQLDAKSITPDRAVAALTHESSMLAGIAASTTDETAPEAIQDVADAVSAYASGAANSGSAAATDLRSVARNAVLGFAAVCPVSDGSFESGTTGWVVTGATLTRTPVAHDGAWAGLLTSTRTKPGAATATAPLRSAVTRSRSGYDIGLWARTDGPPITLTLQIIERRGGATTGSAQQSVTLGSSWQSVSLRYRVKAAGSSLEVRVSVPGLPAGGSIAIDGVWALRH
ncbi:MAG: Carbohydrate binding domain [Frankiales bacterium]|jgi:hypothetical protein|nr:Carbohydrate binding domain [Frankiales bacterium]